MNNLSDTLTIGLVLILLFGSIALYLYTRIQQSEQKVNLLESILLDLKMSNEIKGYTELPADDMEENVSESRTSNANNVNHSAFEQRSSNASEAYVPYHDQGEAIEPVSAEKKQASEPFTAEYQSLDEVLQGTSEVDALATIDTSIVVDAEEVEEEHSDLKPNYESMTLKELQALVKSRGITGVPVKKSSYVDALKLADTAHVPSSLPGSLGVGANSFIETSASFSNEQ